MKLTKTKIAMTHNSVLLLIVFFSLLTGPGNVAAAVPPDEKPANKVWIVQQAWHTGIILTVEDIPASIWPEKIHYKKHKYIDISWGDEKFYQASASPIKLAVRAIIWPTQSVIRVFPFSNPVLSAYGQNARVRSFTFKDKEFISLCNFITESFICDENGEITSSLLDKNSRYYFLAKRKYHLFRTCNTWVALAFKKSGLNIRSCCVLNANQLFRQLDKLTEGM